MKITHTSVMVDDQAKALEFYTRTLGFVKKMDIPAGGARWLTVVSSESASDVELVLEPAAHPAARAYQQAIFADGIPATSFGCADVRAEHRRLAARGVVFRT